MTDYPILFNTPMIRALLREIEAPGTGKTQTRRIIKPQPYGRIAMLTSFNHGRMEIAFGPDMKAKDGGPKWWRPLAQADDRLWVRETWCQDGDTYGQTALYRATEKGAVILDDGDGFAATNMDGSLRSPWRPSIHMPRWASRLTLYVTEVRVERLQDISEADARAEGVECDSDGWRDYLMPQTQCCATAKDSFRTLWDGINGPGAWAKNPWVSVTTFHPVLDNIDGLPATLQEAV